MTAWSSPAASGKLSGPQDIVWIALFAVLAVYGPDLTKESTTVLVGLGLMQVIEPKIPFFGSRAGAIISFLIKLGLWYILMAWTDGIQSSYYWLMLLPVMSAATSLGLAGLVAATVLAGGAYLSFLKFLRPDQFIPPRSVARDHLARIHISDRRLPHL